MESIYAGFWNRFTATFIDNLVIAAGSAMFSLPFLIAKGLSRTTSSPFWGVFDSFWVVFDSILFMLIGWLYCTLLESSTKRATIGKMAVGIIVTDINGNRVSFGRANGRWWGKSISFLILGIGYIMAGFTRKKQALHDIMADTLVLARPEGIRTWLTATIIGGMGVIFLVTISYIILNRQPTRTIDDTQTASVPSSSISKEQPTSTQPPSETVFGGRDKSTVEKALLVHWICETYRAKYPEIYLGHLYFSKDKIVQLNANGQRTEWAYIVIESNNSLNWITIRSQGGATLTKFVFLSDDRSSFETVLYSVPPWKAEGEWSPTGAKFIYVDGKQEDN